MSSTKYRNLFDANYARIVPNQISGPPYTQDPSQPDPLIEFQSSELFTVKLEGRIPHYPIYLLATCTSSELEGHHVYCSAYDATNKVPSVLKCNPNNAATMPSIGQVVKKYSDTICLVHIVAGAEWTNAAALTPGALYYIGSDALPAKAGDANIPAGGDVKQPIGVAISTKLLLKIPGLLTSTF